MATRPHDRAINRFQKNKTVKQLPSQAAVSIPTAVPIAVPIPQTPPRRHFPGMASWSAIAVMCIAAGGLAGCGWLGFQLIVNPQTLLWVNRFLPDWIPIPVTGLKPPQTLSEIRSELIAAERIPGELLPLGTNISFLDHKSSVTDVLLPVLKRQTNCQSNCEQLVELRVYQTTPTRHQNGQHEPHFQLLDQRAIVGPDESFVLTPLINAGDANQGSTRSLPLLTLNRFEGNVPQQGVWLNLSGRWLRGDATIAYGQVMHYNPSRFHLHLMLEWSSPVGQDPTWREMTGKGLPELVINQAVGMEPQFQIYQVKPRNFLPSPLQLEPLLLLEPAIDDATYANGLLLARSGLWSTGGQWLQAVKRRYAKAGKWSTAAQAQLDLVELHAQATQTQADQSWASPSQQVLANLIDGRWKRALTVFEASAENSLETATLLKADPGRLQNRVDAALRVSPMQADVKAWGALLLAAKHDRSAAIAWLKKQPKTTIAELSRVNALLVRLEPPAADAPPPANLPSGQLVGTAQVLSTMNPAVWSKPKQSAALKLPPQQLWYQVQVAGFQDGKRWRFSGSSLGLAGSATDTLWKQLGLTPDAPLEITFWLADGQQQTVSASIKALRLNANGLQLLAAGDAVSAGAKTSSRPRPFAFTDAALQWQNLDTMSLADLVQQQPAWAAKAIPLLGQALKQAGKLPSGTEATWDALEQLGAGNLPVQLAMLTGGSQPDVVLTLDSKALSELSTQAVKRLEKPRTLVFSGAGQLLYSEFSTEAELTYLAIAALGDGGADAIVADGPNNYRLLRWSTKRKRFE